MIVPFKQITEIQKFIHIKIQFIIYTNQTLTKTSYNFDKWEFYNYFLCQTTLNKFIKRYSI